MQSDMTLTHTETSETSIDGAVKLSGRPRARRAAAREGREIVTGSRL